MTLAFAGVVFAVVVGLAAVAAVLVRRSGARRTPHRTRRAEHDRAGPVDWSDPHATDADRSRPRRWETLPVTIARSLLLFVVAALAEIGGAWLVWQGVREHRGWVWIGAGVIALGLYGFVATLQPDAHFGRILAAYGGVFVAGSLAWGMVMDGFRPDRYDISAP